MSGVQRMREEPRHVSATRAILESATETIGRQIEVARQGSALPGCEPINADRATVSSTVLARSAPHIPRVHIEGSPGSRRIRAPVGGFFSLHL